MSKNALHGSALADAIKTLSGWRVVDDHHIERDFKFPDFLTALAFVNRIGDRAETLNHHPDLSLTWGHVGVKLWSHDVGGISERDIGLAKEIDRLAS